MDKINLPGSIDWFNAALVTFTVTVLSGIVRDWGKGKVTESRATSFVFGIIVFDLVAMFIYYNVIGFVLYQNASYRETNQGCAAAISTYKQALSWNPKITEARWRLVSCYIDLNRSPELLTILNPLQDTLSNEWEYWSQIAVAQYANEDYSVMYDAVKKAAELSPATTEWITTLAKGLHRRFKFEEAEKLLRIVRIYNDTDNDAVFWLAWALYELGFYTDAVEHFDLCVERFVSGYENGRCWAGKGFSFKEMGQPIEAKNALNIALAVWPNQDDARTVLNSLP